MACLWITLRGEYQNVTNSPMRSSNATLIDQPATQYSTFKFLVKNSADYRVNMQSDENNFDAKKNGLNILLNYSSDDLSLQDSENSFRTRGQDLIFGNNSFVSMNRGTGDYEDTRNESYFGDSLNTRNSSTPIDNSKNNKGFSEMQFLNDLNVPDSEFLNTEAGKLQLLADQVSHERLYLQRPNCTGCSSWSYCTRRNTSSISLESSKFKQKETVSVGEFIGAFSETLNFSDNLNMQNPFFNCPSSTRIEKRKSSSLSSLLNINIREENKTILEEDGKRRFPADRVFPESSFLQVPNSGGCNSWRFPRNTSPVSLECSKSKQKKAVGEFSEYVNLSDNQKKQNPFFNWPTPIEKRKSISASSLPAIVNKELNSASYLTTPKKSLKCSTPKSQVKDSSYSGDFPFYIGTTLRKNIQRLKREERRLQYIDQTSFSLDETGETIKRQSNVSSAAGFDTYSLTYGSINNSCYEQWYVEPQSVILDSNKGSRVRLINRSSKILKFKSIFDGKLTNICPLSGTVPAEDQIGLRIIISQCAKKQNENFESDIKIVIGKSEKVIRVTFVKEEKCTSVRKRTFITF